MLAFQSHTQVKTSFGGRKGKRSWREVSSKESGASLTAGTRGEVGTSSGKVRGRKCIGAAKSGHCGVVYCIKKRRKIEMNEFSTFAPQSRVAVYDRASTAQQVQMGAQDLQVSYTKKLVADNHHTIVDQDIEPETGTGAGHRLQKQRRIQYTKADRTDVAVVKCTDSL